MKGDPRSMNKIVIEEYMPIVNDIVKNANGKSKGVRSFKSSHTGDLMDEKLEQ